jgi:septal ring factor EnvC (AmiA/AmiB activator)
MIMFAVAIGGGSPARADHGDAAAAQAAADIQSARDRANEASQAMFDAESRIDTLTIEIAAAEKRLAEVQAQASEMRRELEQQAVRSFVNSGATDFPLLLGLDETNDVIVANTNWTIDGPKLRRRR